MSNSGSIANEPQSVMHNRNVAIEIVVDGHLKFRRRGLFTSSQAWSVRMTDEAVTKEAVITSLEILLKGIKDGSAEVVPIYEWSDG